MTRIYDFEKLVPKERGAIVSLAAEDDILFMHTENFTDIYGYRICGLMKHIDFQTKQCVNNPTGYYSIKLESATSNPTTLSQLLTTSSVTLSGQTLFVCQQDLATIKRLSLTEISKLQFVCNIIRPDSAGSRRSDNGR